ncbi:SUMF1/EgtB/PvdO family nonheme iron enzyme [Nostoc sp. MG11]|uniref:SUMF1/EgtB/PvdO family nonheme iron enzyme n=1 Tax=Nostoc sp. MG11 TaxID=2721166 RepID=UPI0018682E1D|nr:SUMF1/EgtB/PvdO family nonheme iron enzyme [Nostoc sp. MG11]
MAKNWAIAIGINQYEYLQPLNYAKRDALLMQEFLGNEAGFERIFFFSDDSPPVDGKSTRPTRTNLLRVLRQLFDNPFMGAGDNFWFFFSGHGIRYADRDYLMPCDGDPEDIENTAIAINFVSERLRRCGADNVVLILDACRNEGKKTGEGIGRQTAEEARQQGVISIFSCSPQEYSYEIEALQQGAFTTALLEGLGIQGQRATVERLNQYLKSRVPEIVSKHKNARQTPYVIAEPVNKSHLILVPQYATLADIATLKIDAYQAEVNRNLDLAEQLWIRVLAAASGQDMDAIKAIQRIARLPERQEPSLPQPPPIIENSTKGEFIVEKNPLKTFQFEVVTVNAQGNITNRRNQEAKYFEENLGNGITLEMVQIPGGTFTMGSPEGEAERRESESPLHQVKVPGFFMGKYAVTQAQYQAIMGTNPSNFKGEKRPVEQVSCDEAVEFCKKLSQKRKHTYRLPSEAEWEYACRAGTTTPFYFGETITTDLVNYDGNNPYGSAPKGEYRKQTIDVGKFPPNSFGLYDMHGNVYEWCEDVYNGNYIDAPTDGKPWLVGSYNNIKLLRGGSWIFNAGLCRSAYRHRYALAIRYGSVGFRVVAVAVA